MPAAVDVLAAGQRRDLVLQRLVVIGYDARFDERAPVTRYIDAVEHQFVMSLQILGTDQRFFMNGHAFSPSSEVVCRR